MEESLPADYLKTKNYIFYWLNKYYKYYPWLKDKEEDLFQSAFLYCLERKNNPNRARNAVIEAMRFEGLNLAKGRKVLTNTVLLNEALATAAEEKYDTTDYEKIMSLAYQNCTIHEIQSLVTDTSDRSEKLSPSEALEYKRTNALRYNAIQRLKKLLEAKK
jgi:hypothetical protein